MSQSIQQFYDDFADVYEFIVPDWKQFVGNQWVIKVMQPYSKILGSDHQAIS